MPKMKITMRKGGKKATLKGDMHRGAMGKRTGKSANVKSF